MVALRRIAALLVLTSALVAPAGAGAQASCEAPPGTGAIDQYCETIPQAQGPGAAGDPSSTRAPRPLPASTLRALRGGGDDARALAESLAGPAGSDRAGKGSEKAGAAPAVQPPSSEDPSSDPFSAIKAAAGSGGGVGAGFVWVLIALTLLMLAAAWLRFRRGHAPD
jgi:hypothetical protein